MSVNGTRGLIRISVNPACELQAAMVHDRIDERAFYHDITGEEFAGEYGERDSARRRGAMFESNLHKEGAARLRTAVAPLYGLNAEAMEVRDLAAELPGKNRAVLAERLARTRVILSDLAEGKPVPHLLIQPQLQLRVGNGATDIMFVAPDFMVLDPSMGIYVPGEEKSFIVRDGVGEPADLDLARRQAGAQILALREEAGLVGIGDRVANRAVFVFASPRGLAPAPPVEERSLDAEVFEVTRAIRTRQDVAAHLTAVRNGERTPLATIANDLAINYQESCVRSCVLATPCKRRCAGTARTIGDAASELLGPDVDLNRIAALLDGAEPATDEEIALLPLLLDAASALPEYSGDRR
jgi:hypothetical protein